MNSFEMNINYVLKEKSSHYLIPSESQCLTEMIWKMSSFNEIKSSLNECKSVLNEIPLKEWSTHTSNTENSSLIKKLIEKRLQTKPLLLSRAWLKFFEILSTFKIIETHLTHRESTRPRAHSRVMPLKCLFLCECPGSFINALNHYIITHFNNNITLEWMANTLNPYYEDIDYTIIDDQFIKDIHCFKNWFFGSTNTGNILDQNFLSDLQKAISNKTKFDFISCDGSVNCVDCPESQEEVIIPLVFSEIIISLNVIKENGSLVVKCFTIFECQTICVLYLLCCAFDEIHVFKPTASKSGNSETYLICIGFKASDGLNSIISLLSKHKITSDSKALFSRESLPQQFLAKLEECVHLFANRQQLTIQNNLKLFKNMTEEKRRQIINQNKYVAKSFIKKYNVFSISICDQLTPHIDYELINCLSFKKLITLLSNTNSYNHRKQIDFFSQIWFKKLSQVLIDMSGALNIKNQLIDFKYWKTTNSKLFPIDLVYGIPYLKIQSSKFCDLSLIISYNLCAKYSQKFKDIGKHLTPFSCETREILKNLVSDLENKTVFSHIISHINSDFVRHFSELSFNANIEIICFSSDHSFNLNSRNIFTINAFDTFSLELIHEKLVLNELISRFCEMISLIGENDLLVIHIGFSLTRLMAATLYLISKLFNYISFVPCIGSDLINRHGLICLFNNRYNDKQLNSQITDNLSLISHQLNSLTPISQELSYGLVEIISVPVLISDAKFYETLFNANSIQMMEILKLMSNIISSDL